MDELSASLIASASGRAFGPAENEKTYCSGAGVFGGWTNIFNITLGLLAGVCCRSTQLLLLALPHVRARGFKNKRTGNMPNW